MKTGWLIKYVFWYYGQNLWKISLPWNLYENLFLEERNVKCIFCCIYCFPLLLQVFLPNIGATTEMNRGCCQLNFQAMLMTQTFY